MIITKKVAEIEEKYTVLGNGRGSNKDHLQGLCQPPLADFLHIIPLASKKEAVYPTLFSSTCPQYYVPYGVKTH
jgi:hypothetical protein